MHLKEKRIGYDQERRCLKPGKSKGQSNEMIEGVCKYIFYLYSCNRLEELEMQKLLEQRKREKEEEKEARQRVRAQIEADKAARRAKAAAESNQLVNTSSTSLSATPSSASTHHRKDYTETRLQVLI